MKKVIGVLRHAQSAGKQTGQRDYDRILTPEGVSEAARMGEKIKKENLSFDLIVSSSAVRTRQTVNGINETLKYPAEKITFLPELYDALMAQWVNHLHGLPEEINSVLLVGHNPWLSMLAGSFTLTPCELGTCELVVFEFQTDSWKTTGSSGKKILNIK